MSETWCHDFWLTNVVLIIVAWSIILQQLCHIYIAKLINKWCRCVSCSYDLRQIEMNRTVKSTQLLFLYPFPYRTKGADRQMVAIFDGGPSDHWLQKNAPWHEKKKKKKNSTGEEKKMLLRFQKFHDNGRTISTQAREKNALRPSIVPHIPDKHSGQSKSLSIQPMSSPPTAIILDSINNSAVPISQKKKHHCQSSKVVISSQ